MMPIRSHFKSARGPERSTQNIPAPCLTARARVSDRLSIPCGNSGRAPKESLAVPDGVRLLEQTHPASWMMRMRVPSGSTIVAMRCPHGCSVIGWRLGRPCRLAGTPTSRMAACSASRSVTRRQQENQLLDTSSSACGKNSSWMWSEDQPAVVMEGFAEAEAPVEVRSYVEVSRREVRSRAVAHAPRIERLAAGASDRSANGTSRGSPAMLLPSTGRRWAGLGQREAPTGEGTLKAGDCATIRRSGAGRLPGGIRVGPHGRRGWHPSRSAQQ
jgi:hypothetical protein